MIINYERYYAMKIKQLVSVSMIALMLTACATGPNGEPVNSMGTKQTMGTILGGVGGAFAGSTIGKGDGRLAAVAVGTLLGAALGNSVGQSLDNADMAMYNQTSQRALETTQPGQTLPWSNPQTGNSGSITPTNVYQTAEGGYCREYTQTINVGGKTQKGYGRACRQPDGTWNIVE
jgi:surface antigen